MPDLAVHLCEPPTLLPLPSSPSPSLLSIIAEQTEAATEPSVAVLDELFPFLKGNSPLLQPALMAGGELCSKRHFPKASQTHRANVEIVEKDAC